MQKLSFCKIIAESKNSQKLYHLHSGAKPGNSHGGGDSPSPLPTPPPPLSKALRPRLVGTG